ncbi:unnamed protein product [Strongylus vulgaris]|uniref:Uncharacterized protein n=1 Tax=Strongylus vulgaris TaxID=40348 RepID=A0A3P7IZV2_STRVU|nr:unnamed protein product [Strongylus vulgaris]
MPDEIVKTRDGRKRLNYKAAFFTGEMVSGTYEEQDCIRNCNRCKHYVNTKKMAAAAAPENCPGSEGGEEEGITMVCKVSGNYADQLR